MLLGHSHSHSFSYYYQVEILQWCPKGPVLIWNTYPAAIFPLLISTYPLENFFNLNCLSITGSVTKYLLLNIQLSKTSAAHALFIYWLLLSKEADKMICPIFFFNSLLPVIVLELVNWHFQIVKYHAFPLQVLSKTWTPNTSCIPVQITNGQFSYQLNQQNNIAIFKFYLFFLQHFLISSLCPCQTILCTTAF